MFPSYLQPTRWLTTAALLSICILHGAVGHAEPTKKDLEAAKKSFFEAIDLESKNQWAEALAKFEEVAKVKMTPQVRFHVALCQEKVGRLRDALANFERAAKDAEADRIEGVTREAPEHIKALRLRVASVMIQLPVGVTASITIDQEPVDAGAPELRLDPGTHVLLATSEGHKPFRKELALAEGASEIISIELEPLPVEAPKPPPPPPPKQTPPVSTADRYPLVPIVMAGVGVLMLGTGGVFMSLRQDKIGQLDAACGPSRLQCPPSMQGAIDDGHTFTTLSNVMLVGGTLATAGGVALFFLLRKPSVERKQTAVELLPTAPFAELGASLRATF